MVKNTTAIRETWARSLGWEDPLEKEMATHSYILAWRVPIDRGAWQATVPGVTESDTIERLSTTHHQNHSAKTSCIPALFLAPLLCLMALQVPKLWPLTGTIKYTHSSRVRSRVPQVCFWVNWSEPQTLWFSLLSTGLVHTMVCGLVSRVNYKLKDTCSLEEKLWPT